jgi:hypothetical protein
MRAQCDSSPALSASNTASSTAGHSERTQENVGTIDQFTN